MATNVVNWSENLGPIHGRPRGWQPADYAAFLELIHPADRDLISAAVVRAAREGEGYDIELRCAPVDGEVQWILAHASVLTNADGSPRRIVGLTRNVTERKLREERADLLSEASQLLLRETDREPPLGAFAALAVERLADRCAVHVAEDLEIASVCAVRMPGAAIAAADPGPLVTAAGSGPTVRLHTQLDGADGSDPAWLEREGLRSLVVAPLTLGERRLGTMVLAAGDGRRRYQPADAQLASELAGRVALAIDAARLKRLADAARTEAERAADRAHRLADVTAGLAAAATTTEIADVIVNVGIPALSATTGILGILDEPDQLTFVRTVGYGSVFPESLPLDAAWPIVTAVRERRLVELRDVAERRASWDVPEEVWWSSGQGTLVAVPLLVRDRPIGALGFTRELSDALTDDELQLVETLARQAAHALDRAALYEADRRARLQAEGLHRVTSAVASAVTMEEVAESVADEALAVLDAQGVTIVLSSSADAGLADVLASQGDVAPHAEREPRIDLHGGTVTAAALRGEHGIFVESLEELERGWPASAAVARQLGVGAIACVPFAVGERRGAVSVVSSRPRRFLVEDRRFLDLLGRTCEQGLLRAALFEAERDAHVRSDVLHGLAAALSGAVTPSDVGEAYLEHALQYFEAGSGALALADASGTTLEVVALGGSGTTRRQWLSTLPVDDDYIIATAFRQGRAVTASSRAELEVAFPRSAERFEPDGRAAYAGPLLVGGVKLGAFALVFERDRVVDGDDARLLDTMAELCAQAIERARLYESEHRIASRLQRAMLPEGVVHRPELEIAAYYRAGAESLEIGGDWYDTFELPDGRVGIAVGDVVGQGIEAGAAMGRMRSALAAYALDEHEPDAVMARLNRFSASPGGVEFATACYAVLDPSTGELSYCSAGHPPMLVLDPNGRERWLEGGRAQPLYGSTDYQASAATDQLEPGSLLLVYSDGLVERRGEHIEHGLARLVAVARGVRELAAEALCRALVETMSGGEHGADDVVVVALRTIPVATRPFRDVFPARPDELRRVRNAARTWLAESDVPASRTDDIVLVLGEACSNAVEHAYCRQGGTGEVEVELQSGDAGVVLSVRDRGSWRPEREDTERGRGYQIMRALGEQVEVETGPAGTAVTVVFSVPVEARA